MGAHSRNRLKSFRKPVSVNTVGDINIHHTQAPATLELVTLG